MQLLFWNLIPRCHSDSHDACIPNGQSLLEGLRRFLCLGEGSWYEVSPSLPK